MASQQKDLRSTSRRVRVHTSCCIDSRKRSARVGPLHHAKEAEILVEPVW
jgi:hypothetical protein